jgi:hypothetical protein|tara:strand:- start:1665 stop:2033 length:369 start_codon:yes stop_codon:yes gene_type:complete
MRNILYIFFLLVVSVPNLSADSYIATRQELWFSDSSYYKTSHHIKVGKSVILDNYRLFGEVGFGEDINEGTPIGSGASYDYLRFGVTRTFFNSLKLNVNYRSKMKSVGRDLNWIVINTKYTF